MKKITSVILAIALIFALAVTAMAAEIADCTVSADSVSATAGTHPHFREPGLYQFRHCSGL